jgi:methionine-rich copper-binding protein CopC
VTGSVWVEQAVGGDCVTAAYSPNGESLWCAFYNGPGDWSDVGRAIAVSEVGWVLVAGSSDGTGFNMDIMAIKYIQDGAVADQPRPRVVSALLTPEARPNPFSARTAINFQTPAGGETNVLVFDVAGRLVKVLVAGPLTAGVHVVGWNGSDSDGHPVPAGVYTVRLVTEQTKQSVKVVVLD